MPERSTVLIVDDDPRMCDSVKELLRRQSYELNTCNSGKQAVEYIEKNAVDLVLLDMMMPDMDGHQIMDFLSQRRPDTLIIVITGHASMESAIISMKRGAYDYIRKPCKVEEIKIVIDNAVEKIRLNRENSILTEKLHNAYQELTDAKRKINNDEKKANVNFFSSNISNLHHLYSADDHNNDYFDRLQALSALRQNGILNESEFNTFKKHLIKMIDHKK